MNEQPETGIAIPLRYDGNRIYDAKDREILVATKSDPHLRHHTIDTAYQVCLVMNTQPELLKIAQAYRNLLKTMAHTEEEVATFNHINAVIAAAGVEL